MVGLRTENQRAGQQALAFLQVRDLLVIDMSSRFLRDAPPCP